ncbi:MAG TPA: hypothetical protein VFJ46_19480 [Xanthobacteraceae bacterium]|jgi:hypothetical protein|nr:hypothetical protein [Xanthobacteraceae bacterium]
MKRIILIASFAATAAIAAGAPQPLDAQQPQPGSANAYLPVLADIMSGTQLRHLKLAYSGKVKNWQLADYELGQIQKSFADAAQLYPVFKNIPLAELIKSESEPPLADLRKSIDAKNLDDFARAFGKLTDACNRCHRAAGVGFIVIRIPTSSPFSNQLFPPTETR